MTDEVSVLIRVQTVYRVLVLPVFALISGVEGGSHLESVKHVQYGPN